VSPGDQGEVVQPSHQVSGALLDERNSQSSSVGASFRDGVSQNGVTDGHRESFTDEQMELFETF